MYLSDAVEKPSNENWLKMKQKQFEEMSHTTLAALPSSPLIDLKIELVVQLEFG